ncbi:unnamed protein product, partial [Didymodactylos carnosus]
FLSLYIGLTTGLCGSITTFSGVMYDAGLALYGSVYGRYPVSDYLFLLISIFSSSFAGFLFGRHLAVLTTLSQQKEKKHDGQQSVQQEIKLEKASSVQIFHTFNLRLWLFPLLIVLSIPAILAIIVTLPNTNNTYIYYSVLFAPFGSLTRWLLSFLNVRFKKFPLGTFICNFTGSCLYLGIIAIMIYTSANNNLLQKQVLMAILQGYCGCLTTVSTLVLETSTMKRLYAFVYFFISVISVQIIFLSVGGGLRALFTT